MLSHSLKNTMITSPVNQSTKHQLYVVLTGLYRADLPINKALHVMIDKAIDGYNIQLPKCTLQGEYLMKTNLEKTDNNCKWKKRILVWNVDTQISRWKLYCQYGRTVTDDIVYFVYSIVYKCIQSSHVIMQKITSYTYASLPNNVYKHSFNLTAGSQTTCLHIRLWLNSSIKKSTA